jgi:regulatory protein
VSRLMAKGVDRGTVELALEESAPGSDEERALEVALARASRLRGVPPAQAFPRLVAFLARRGYDPSVSRSAARRALGASRDLA